MTRVRVALLGVVLAAGAATGQPPAAGPVAATVNGEPIPLDQVDQFIRTRFPGLPLTPTQLKALRTEVANDFADDLLVRQFLRKSGPKVDPAEVDRQLAAFADSLKAKGQTLAGYLKDTHQTEAGLRETWADLIALQGYVREHVSDLELQKYFEANRDHFDGVEVKAAHILFRAPATAPAVERAVAREKLAALRAEIAAGKLDFAAAAKTYSHGPSAARGGDLGFICRKGGLQDDAFARAAFAMKVGELSGVVETPSGFHLIRVAARTPGTPAAFEKCVEDVRETYADDLRGDLLPKLRREGQVVVTVP
jgi:parvulin-like peptidyl-prolyl isomerase